MAGQNVLEINDGKLRVAGDWLHGAVPARLQRGVVRPLQGARAHRREARRRVQRQDQGGEARHRRLAQRRYQVRHPRRAYRPRFKGGKESGRHVGVTNKETLIKLLGLSQVAKGEAL